MDKQIRDYLKKNGSKGGKKTKELHPDHHKQAGKLGALKRWGKRQTTTKQS